MNRWFETPQGLIVFGLALTGSIWVFGKLFGISFVVVGFTVIGFLIALASYLTLHLFDDPLLQRIQSFFTRPRD